MEGAPTVPAAIYVIWWTVLLVVLVVIVPLAVVLLHRTLRAARSIRRYLAEMLGAGVGIAGNTDSIVALSDTTAVAGDLLKAAENLQQHSGTIAEVLSQRAASGKAS